MRSKMATAGRVRATSMFDLDRMLSRFDSIYADLHEESPRLNLGNAKALASDRGGLRHSVARTLVPAGYSDFA